MPDVRCRQCDRTVPRFRAAMVACPIAHVDPNSAPCRPLVRWPRQRIGECYAWQAENLDALELAA